MSAWKSRGLRGSTLEEMVNRSNEKYRESGLALVQKIPTPITPIKIGKESRHITLAYFDQKSTVDYVGAVQGIPVCFDAKECGTDSFPLSNVHGHQIDFMRDFEAQQGLAFLLIFFSGRDRYYYMRLSELLRFTERAEGGGRKSVHIDELDPAFFLEQERGVFVPYLDGIQRDLQERGKATEGERT